MITMTEGHERIGSVDELYRRRYEAELRRASLLIQPDAAAQDVVAEAFCEVIRRWDQIDNPAAYLSRAVLNGCRRTGKRRKREQPIAVDASSPTDRLTNDHLDEMADVVARLPWKQRAIVVLKYYEGRTEADIADILGIRPGSVGPTARRALDNLRKEIA